MRAILDSGPLVALWNAESELAAWVHDLFQRFSGPYYVTEPMLTEVSHLTGRDKAIIEGLRTGRFLLTEGLIEQVADIERVLDQFPHADLADASLVALSERHRRLSILSTDRRHFLTYRREDGTALQLELPPAT
jgi:predicted nucleic acid-binding protein